MYRPRSVGASMTPGGRARELLRKAKRWLPGWKIAFPISHQARPKPGPHGSLGFRDCCAGGSLFDVRQPLGYYVRLPANPNYPCARHSWAAPFC